MWQGTQFNGGERQMRIVVNVVGIVADVFTLLVKHSAEA